MNYQATKDYPFGIYVIVPQVKVLATLGDKEGIT